MISKGVFVISLATKKNICQLQTDLFSSKAWWMEIWVFQRRILGHKSITPWLKGVKQTHVLA